jgi:hypothetical protein
MAEHKSLWAALLAFKAEAPSLPKDKTNPHYRSKYTPLDTIAEKIDPLLTKHGLVWAALPGHDQGRPTLNYTLAHAPSGEVMSGEMPLLLDRENSQGVGSALTYARRYCKVAVLDLVADEDDDGNAASQRKASVPPYGRPYDKARAKDIGTSCRALCDGDADKAKLLYKVVSDDCGGYMPEAAAIALIRAANAGMLFPEVKAPEL